MHQRKASYLDEAIEVCSSDPAPEVSGLAKAIASPTDQKLHLEFRDKLSSENFMMPWSVLRLLRVVPIPELAGDLCSLLDQSREGKGLDYDVLYSLSNPVMAPIAAPILSENPGVAGFLERLLTNARSANENATRNWSPLLTYFDATEVDRALDDMQKKEFLRKASEVVRGHLQNWRRRTQTVGFERTFSAFVPDRTTFGPRTKGELLDDSLGVRMHAGHIAQLIAAKDTWMPLSIGLFGPWGSGKTYFIDLLDESLAALPKGKDSVFHEHIVQIRFNAWHYLDTNLWANLVCEIFDQLFRKLHEDASGKPDQELQIQKLKDELARQSALAAEANEALRAAEAARVKAEEELRQATRERETKESRVRGMLDDLAALLKDVEDNSVVQGQLRTAADILGLPKLETSFSELEARVAEMRSLEGRFKAVLLATFNGPGWWVKGVLLVAAIGAPLGVTWLANHGGPWLQEMLAGAGRVIAQVISAVGLVSTWISAQVKAGNSVVGKLEGAYDKVKMVRSERESKGDAAQAQKELAAKRQTEETARHTLREAEEKMKAISAELAELAPGRQLIRFLKARASAEDYQRHLGLVSLVRKDFEQLSELLTRTGSEKDPSLPSIDRIVLYIDDLDRCRADRVIEVLEAVHLLLAFPLFAVVVAVDPRWLRQSLLDHYPRLLGGNEGYGAAIMSQPRIGRPATPQDYLEKIFQVPFNLQRMEKNGFETLVSHLFRPPKPRVEKTEETVEPSPKPLVPNPGNAPASQLASVLEPTPAVQTVPNTVVPPDGLKTPGLPVEEKSATQSVPAAPGNVERPKKEAPAPPADPKKLILTDKEVIDVQRFQPLFQTPRAVKRMANTYCLIRVGVSEKEWTAYLGTGETPGSYRIPLLLLAVTSAFPSLARPWLLWMMEPSSRTWVLTTDDVNALSAKHADITCRQSGNNYPLP